LAIATANVQAWKEDGWQPSDAATATGSTPRPARWRVVSFTALRARSARRRRPQGPLR